MENVMEVKRYNSLIKTLISDKMMREMEKIYYAKNSFIISKKLFNSYKRIDTLRYKNYDDDNIEIQIRNNNDKIVLFKNLIWRYWDDSVTFGTGTNRLGVIHNSYVFKIACDYAGCVDNMHEFIMSKELQPYVLKTYETNELIAVSEYVRVYNKDADFENAKDEILEILRDLSQRTSLMIDVGFITKNKTNWGYRPSDGKSVILDYGYIYTELDGISLACSDKKCNKSNGVVRLEYTENYSELICPKCGAKYGSDKLQCLITQEARTKMYKNKLKDAIKVNKSVTYIGIDAFGAMREMNETESSQVLSTVEVNRLNYDEVVSEYIKISVDAERQLLFYGEINEETSIMKEQLRRSLLELKYKKRYDKLTDVQQEEEPYQPDDLDSDSYNEIIKYKKEDEENYLSHIYNEIPESKDNNEIFEQIQNDMDSNEYGDLDLYKYKSRDEMLKGLSRQLYRRGEETLVEIDPEEENKIIVTDSKKLEKDVWGEVYKPEPVSKLYIDTEEEFEDVDFMQLEKQMQEKRKRKEFFEDYEYDKTEDILGTDENGQYEDNESIIEEIDAEVKSFVDETVKKEDEYEEPDIEDIKKIVQQASEIDLEIDEEEVTGACYYIPKLFKGDDGKIIDIHLERIEIKSELIQNLPVNIEGLEIEDIYNDGNDIYLLTEIEDWTFDCEIPAYVKLM